MDDVARRNNPDFAQLSAYIPKDAIKEFKLAYTDLEIPQADALEQAVRMWVEKYKEEKAKKEGNGK
jgi:hypothetical protein